MKAFDNDKNIFALLDSAPVVCNILW